SPATLLLSLKNNRVVAGTSQLRISEFYTQGEHNSTGSASSDKTGGQYLLKVSAFTWVIKDGTTKRRKLELVSQYSLFGNIECLKAVRLAGNSRDLLLLSFKDAKLAVVDYDPGTHDQKTKSLHFFEDKQKSKIVEFFGKPLQC
ncbi:hypothetical protein pdam_00022855, partial [Pocillopora damicornis]